MLGFRHLQLLLFVLFEQQGDEMPKVTKTVGSGMTERGIVHFDWYEPGDVDAQVRAAIEASDRSSFQRMSRRLGDLATSILVEAELPSDPDKEYLVGPDSALPALEGEVSQLDADWLPLDVAVIACGHAPDSPQGYAAAVLMLLRSARQQLQAGSFDEAMATAVAIGEVVNEAGMKDMFEKDFLAGEKVRAGGRRAHEQTHGTQEEKDARRAAYLQAYDSERAEGANKTNAYKVVAKTFHVHPITVRRAVASARSPRLTDHSSH